MSEGEGGTRTEADGLAAGGTEGGDVTGGMAGIEEGAAFGGEGGRVRGGRDVGVGAPAEVPDEEGGEREDDKDDGYADACGDGAVGSHLRARLLRECLRVRGGGVWDSQ